MEFALEKYFLQNTVKSSNIKKLILFIYLENRWSLQSFYNHSQPQSVNFLYYTNFVITSYNYNNQKK